MKKTIRNDGILCAFPAVTCIILPLCLHAALQNYLRSFGGPAAGMAVYSLISVFYAALYGFMQYFFIECNNRYHLASVIAGMLEMAAAFFLLPRYCRFCQEAFYARAGWISLTTAMGVMLYGYLFIKSVKRGGSL